MDHIVHSSYSIPYTGIIFTWSQRNWAHLEELLCCRFTPKSMLMELPYVVRTACYSGLNTARRHQRVRPWWQPDPACWRQWWCTAPRQALVSVGPSIPLDPSSLWKAEKHHNSCILCIKKAFAPDLEGQKRYLVHCIFFTLYRDSLQ